MPHHAASVHHHRTRSKRGRAAEAAIRRLAISLTGVVLLAASSIPDARADEERAVFNRSTYSSQIPISRDDRLVWVVNPEDDTVSVIRTDTRSLLDTINVGNEPRSVALHPDNTFAFVANALGSSVTVIKIYDASFANFDA